MERTVNNGLYAAGFVSYEAAPAFDPALTTHPPDDFPLAWFGLYPAPCRIADPGLTASTSTDISFDIPWQATVNADDYREAIRKIKNWIGKGETYQVNYTFRLRAPFHGDPRQIFTQMIRTQGSGYGAFVNTERWTLCSASPELFFSLSNRNLTCRPMKGTAPRGLTRQDDDRQAAELAASSKNRAENVMIVDMVRNDMGRLAQEVHVTDLYRIEKYPTLWQMTSEVHCMTDAGFTDIFRALFPAASITGAPKVQTTKLIADLEDSPRRIYTGAIGFLTPDKRAQFNVAIRSLLIDKQNETAEYGVGGGIVWDSETDSELDECHVKARILIRSHPEFELLESFLWTPAGGYHFLQEHLERLTDSASYFTWQMDPKVIRGTLDEFAQNLRGCPHKIRLLLSRNGKIHIEGVPLIALPTPYRIGLAHSPIDPHDVFLYHKTTRRIVYDQALAEAPGYDDLLLWNERGELTESCRANLIIELDGMLLTPPVSCGLLPGTCRASLLQKGLIREGKIHRNDLKRCTAVYLANAVRGRWQVFPEQSRNNKIQPID